jgi:putative nucleotidyltransferase with HDIG domain
MALRRVQVYVALTTVLAGVLLALQDWTPLYALSLRDYFGLIALLVLGFLAESRTLSYTIAKKPGSTSSIGFLPLLASVLLFGPPAAVLYITVTGIIGEFLIRKKETIKALFNSSQYIVSASLAGFAFKSVGGGALAFEPGAFNPAGPQLVAFFGFGFAFLVVNHAAVSTVISLSEGIPLRKVWVRLVGKSGTNLGYDILISPIAIAFAYLYLALWVYGLFLSILPLLFIRHAYQTILELQQSNRDLLRALVKAIETRDPYTSGHSLRVASLALGIADAMGLSPKRQANVEQAALLHDIGKIEAVYSPILTKRHSLTRQEQSIIKSHVMKGVELLEEMSSFSKEVIAAVKGHHERIDGKGYPDGLAGDSIPLAARIIKVCDAIDAMLSDRPYRKALNLTAVREQLTEHAGTQFDQKIVQLILDNELLEKHATDLILMGANKSDPGVSADIEKEESITYSTVS